MYLAENPHCVRLWYKVSYLTWGSLSRPHVHLTLSRVNIGFLRSELKERYCIVSKLHMILGYTMCRSLTYSLSLFLVFQFCRFIVWFSFSLRVIFRLINLSRYVFFVQTSSRTLIQFSPDPVVGNIYIHFSIYDPEVFLFFLFFSFRDSRFRLAFAVASDNTKSTRIVTVSLLNYCIHDQKQTKLKIDQEDKFEEISFLGLKFPAFGTIYLYLCNLNSSVS